MPGEKMRRSLAAILALDVVGYSRLMGNDETGTLAAVKAAFSDVVEPAVAVTDGSIVKRMGDGLLVRFASAVNAVTCAMTIQHAMAKKDRSAPHLVFRCGVNLGDIIVEDGDIYGDGVNVAARPRSIVQTRRDLGLAG